jgi:hypothetical protein
MQAQRIWNWFQYLLPQLASTIIIKIIKKKVVKTCQKVVKKLSKDVKSGQKIVKKMSKKCKKLSQSWQKIVKKLSKFLQTWLNSKKVSCKEKKKKVPWCKKNIFLNQVQWCNSGKSANCAIVKNKNWIVRRPGAIRSEVGTAYIKFVP